MKHWRIFTSACFVLVNALSSAYAVDDSSGKMDCIGDATVRTAYELRIVGGENKEVLAQLQKIFKENAAVLKDGECEPVKFKYEKGAPALSFSCDKPSAKTDDFFRSLLLVKAPAKAKYSATAENTAGAPAAPTPALKLTTSSLLLPSTCVLEYCCGIAQAEACKKSNRTKPCTVCPTY